MRKHLTKITILLILIAMVSLVFGSFLSNSASDIFWCGLFMWLLIVALGGLLDSYFIASSIVILPLCIISQISFFKLRITGSPLSIADFSLWNKVTNIAKLNGKSLLVYSEAIILLAVTIAVLLLILIVDSKITTRKRKWMITALAALIFVILFVVVRPYTIESKASLLKLWDAATIKKEETSRKEVDISSVISKHEEEQTGEEEEVQNPEEKPNVIVMLSESFFDVTELKGVEYKNDPLSEFHRIQNDENCISGKLYTRSMGYGTSTIELEILTGISTVYLGEDQYISQWPTQKLEKIDSIPKLYKQAGYDTYYLHTYNDSIYGRQTPYTTLGFDRLFFSNDLGRILYEWKEGLAREEQTEENYWKWLSENYLAGDYYSDDLIAKCSIRLCEEIDEPCFIFAATMENHTPYEPDKYDEYDDVFTTSLTGKPKGVINAITKAVSNSSDMLGEICDYFAQSDEPTVVIFFGDHKPQTVVNNDTLYNMLGISGVDALDWSLQEKEEMYTTDYLIWTNDAKYLPVTNVSNNNRSTNFFGLDVLAAGKIELTDEWRLVKASSKIFDAWNHFYFKDANGVMYDDPSQCSNEKIREYLNTISSYYQNKYN